MDGCNLTALNSIQQDCTSESQLTEALNKATHHDKTHPPKLWINVTTPDHTSDWSQPSLTLGAALKILQTHYSLSAFSVLDALRATHRCKLDRDERSIYCSLLAFSCNKEAQGNAGGATLVSPSKGSSLRLGRRSGARGKGKTPPIEEPLLSIASLQFSGEAAAMMTLHTSSCLIILIDSLYIS